MADKFEKHNEKTTLLQVKTGSGLKPVSSKVDFPKLDHEVLAFWDRNKIFQRSIDERTGGPDFVAYDGPPGTNGVPHIGHMMQSALKDLWPRYYTMKGCRVLRKAGWDTHGLPVELTAERELGLHSKREILEYGLENYIDYCRKTVFRYKDAWTEAIRRIGRFLDTDNYYATLTKEYIQTDWWVLKQAWDKNLLYQGHRVMPHCPRCETSLSAHETAQGYMDISDISLYVKFRTIDDENTYFITWTTTAWTLLSNVALAVNPDLTYVTIQVGEQRYILAEARLELLSKAIGEYTIIQRRKGSELAGLGYKPLWDFLDNVGEGAHRVFADSYVTAEDGSGIVHLALYGEDDFRIITANNLPIVQNVDLDGVVKENVTPFAGRWFRDEDLEIDILKNLAAQGLLLSKVKIEHSYPHCYRCDTPLMYFAKSGWFLRTSSFKAEMMAANDDINWYPGHIKHGRFGNWLENNIDWAISRERFWGSPLPLWTCTGCDEQLCVGSLEELSSLLSEPLPGDFDPHKPHIDRVEIECRKCGGTMKHEPEIIDPWFNAGIMPWGQWGYPARAGSREVFDNQYPADFICEAIDQTRGWFYTLLATSTLLTNKSSFKNVICTELILDDAGQKMSKSRGNIVSPIDVCEKFGADAVRWNFYSVNPWTVRHFNETDVRETLKQVIIPYWNAYSFFVTYAIVDDWNPGAESGKSRRLLDRWILSRFEWLRESVETHICAYDVTRAAGVIDTFIDELTNWYIRRSRRRFWKSEDDADKKDAYGTLHRVLVRLNRLVAPFIPFVSEVIYQNLERGFDSSAPDSVHLCLLPDPATGDRDLDIENRMALTRKIVSIGRGLRNEGGIRVRQPLREVFVYGLEFDLSSEFTDLVLDELNVKEFRIAEDTAELFRYSAKADYKALGSRLGSKMREVARAVENLSERELTEFISQGEIRIAGDVISLDDVILSQAANPGLWVRTETGLTVAVSNQVDEDLYSEWLAREFVHHVQNIRRDEDLDVIERIRIFYDGSEQLKNAVNKHLFYIKTETLAVEISDNSGGKELNALKIGDQAGSISIQSIQQG